MRAREGGAWRTWASMVRRGRARSSQFGIHQLARPASSMNAGTRTRRTKVASIRIAKAMPMPKALIGRSSEKSANAPKTATRIAAAAVITRADAPIP